VSRPPRPGAVVAGLLGVTLVLLVPLMAGDENFPKHASGSAVTRVPAPGGQACGARWGPAVEIGRIPGQRKEVSGFVASARIPGVAWMVRDSGNPVVLYSFELPAGEHEIRSRAFPVRGAGVGNGDWEDVAYTIGPDGRGRLWILDNINRHTAPKTLWEVVEPDPVRDREATVVGRYRWAYPDVPDGNKDTETAFFLGGALFVVSKTEPSRVYRFDQPLDASTVNHPTPVATVPAGVRMVLGSTSADERLLVLSATRGQTTWVYANRHDPPDIAGFFDQAPIFSRRMPRSQREAGDFFPYDGCDIVLLSERQNVWLLRNRR
jgi:hypothetical protein